MNDDTIEAIAIAIYNEFRSNKVLPAWSNLPDHRREVWRRAARAAHREMVAIAKRVVLGRVAATV